MSTSRSISIPTGAIKRMYENRNLSTAKISIPTGAIKTGYINTIFFILFSISIPTGAIKTKTYSLIINKIIHYFNSYWCD